MQTICKSSVYICWMGKITQDRIAVFYEQLICLMWILVQKFDVTGSIQNIKTKQSRMHDEWTPNFQSSRQQHLSAQLMLTGASDMSDQRVFQFHYQLHILERQIRTEEISFVIRWLRNSEDPNRWVTAHLFQTNNVVVTWIMKICILYERFLLNMCLG